MRWTNREREVTASPDTKQMMQQDDGAPKYTDVGFSFKRCVKSNNVLNVCRFQATYQNILIHPIRYLLMSINICLMLLFFFF